MSNETLKQTTDVWCPNYPRRVAGLADTSRGWGQKTALDQSQLLGFLNEVKYKAPGFVSVYSFPNGHTSNGENVPKLDTLMFDLDFEGSTDDPTSKWARDMSALLTRTRMLAKALLDMGKAKYWRASLSGHKGIHLYLDFPAIDIDESESKFRNGMRSYTNDIVTALLDETGISDLEQYFDVSSGKDLARLTRCPNTVHEGATKRFGELRYCVPVTIEELANIQPKDYVNLTSNTREITDKMRRVENEKAGEILTNEIKLAGNSTFDNTKNGTYDASRISEYRQTTNDAVTLDKVQFHLKRKPCIWAFRESGEMFQRGQASHIMELNCIAAMMDLRTPIDVMVEFFNTSNEFDEEYTEQQVFTLIGYGYSEFNCRKIIDKAEEFCLKEKCNIYNNADDLQELSTSE